MRRVIQVLRVRKTIILAFLTSFVTVVCVLQLANRVLVNIRFAPSAPVIEYTDSSIAAATLKKIKDLTDCIDRPLDTYYQQRGDFWVLYNYVRAERRYHCHESITYTTQSDFTFLDNLEILVDRWQGPISVALYAPGSDYQASLDSIGYLRNCANPLIKKYVTFHLFFDAKHIPKQIPAPIRKLRWAAQDCNRTAPYKNFDPQKTYRASKKLTYPINVARNIARESAQTYFVFASDIELYPSVNLIGNFLEMVSNKPGLYKISPATVFALPVFEINQGAKIPQTKNDLLKLIAKKKAFVFHRKLCSLCHEIPNSTEWTEMKETKGLDVFTVTKRKGKYTHWEPFYIGTNREPWFDERLTWEGQSNKMVQGYIMCLLDYDYAVLDNAFLVHKPGIKRQKSQLQKHAGLVKETNHLIQTVIKKELITIYGENRGCA